MPRIVGSLRRNAKGQEVADLHRVLRELGHVISPGELGARAFGSSTESAVRDLQARNQLPSTGVIDAGTAKVLESSPEAAALTRGHVSGWIHLESGAPAAGLGVRAYSRGFGGRDAKLAEGSTGDDGSYVLAYDRPGDPVNLEIRAVGRAGREVVLSETVFGAAREETRNLVAPAAIQRVAPEHERLTADAARVLGDAAKLAEAQEGDGRRDLSVIQEATGWDARLVALASTAERLAQETKVPSSALYALLRMGLPAEPAELARVSPAAVDRALRRAAAAGIVQGGKEPLAQAREAFARFAKTARLQAKAPGAASTIGELLDAARLPQAERAAWEETYFDRANGDDLWRSAEKNGVSSDSIDRLKLQGKLARLTLNNAPLAARLQRSVKSAQRLPKLVDQGLYEPQAWKDHLSAMADTEEALAALIPPGFAGEKTPDRLDAYAADLARKVRLAFPTEVVGRMLEVGELRLAGGQEVGALLGKAASLGFQLGRVPVEGFVREHRDELFAAGESPEKVGSAVEGLKTVQRIYQITPTNGAMQTLLGAGLRSAQDVTAFDRATFLSLYGAKFASLIEAELVHRKARQVRSVTYGFFTSASALDSTPDVFAVSGGHEERAAAKDDIVKQYPTMEQLFGSLDFCECEHCRSVLSPAAYLVDLLRFLDPPEIVWDGVVQTWNASHDKKFGTPAAPKDYDKPYDQLFQRRPDLPNLPLTCENTLTALPYIDVVNEILEYYVAHGALAEDASHDTGDATSQQLLAEPQYVLAPAYGVLGGAKYPLGLPFDLWLETVRGFLAYFETPLSEVLETFRASDELFRPQGDTDTPYFRSAVFAESLGLAPAEWALFTDSDTAAKWWEAYGYPNAAAAAELESAKTLARRLGVTYKQLIQLVKTSFANPGLAPLTPLSKLGVSFDEVYRYENAPGRPAMTAAERASFEQELDDFQAATGFDAKQWIDDRYAEGAFDSALVLAEPGAGCDFAATKLQYANGAAVSGLDLLRINLFVRLRAKLGWSIDELDQALTTLLPKNALPLTEANLGAALATALLYLAHLKTLLGRVSIGRNARIKLPALWADISTRGKNSLYAQLFLPPSSRNDPVFDAPAGNYLADTSKFLKDHRTTVQAALTLTADDLERALKDANVDLATAPLSLANVSLLYRYGLLSRGLKLPLRSLLALKGLSGLNPFEPLSGDPLRSDPQSPSPLADDHPFRHTLGFVEAASAVKDSGFAVEELDYLLRHRADPAGPYGPDPAALLTLVRDLAGEIARSRVENAPPDDPTAIDDDALRQKLALVLPADAVDTLLAMWAGTIEYAAVQPNVAPADALDSAQMPAGLSVAYDDVTQEQHLTRRGVLLDPERAQIEAASGSPVLTALLDQVQARAQAFYDDYLAAFLAPSDFPVLFKPVPSAPSQAQATIGAKRTRMVTRLFPYLTARLTRQIVLARLAGALEAEPRLLEALLTSPDLISDPAQAGPLLDSFAAAADPGASGAFFASGDGTGAPLASSTTSDVDTRTKPNGAASARFEGYLQVPAAGAYRFFVQLEKQSARAELRFAHLPDPVVSATAAADGDEPSGLVELKPGVPYAFSLDVHELGGADARLLVIADALPKGPVSRLVLHPASVVERVRRAHTLLTKALRLITGFALDEREMRHLLTHPQDFAGLDLSTLPTEEIGEPAAAQRFAWFLSLARYRALKQALEVEGSELIDVFENARHVHPASADADAAKDALLHDLCDRVAKLTRRDLATVETTAAQLGFDATSSSVSGGLLVEAPAFAQEQRLGRLWDALRVVEQLGAPADAIARWTKIVDPAAPDRQAIADDLRGTVKSRLEDDAWLTVAQPIFDGLRRAKRDALVAYIVHRENLERADELYERFLVDPGMEPVVQTSRLQLAISSVQLFVQRCLLNLEPRVPAAAIDGKRWQWMKRYRVWEANRKIFLYPENWLEPEFREKTHLGRELDETLLQGDVSNDAAEDAFLHYLNGLETIARLQIVTMYAEEDPFHGGTLHVFGRTYGAPHKYFYRRCVNQAWTAWEPVSAEVEGDHVAAVVWRDRPHLFWLTFADKSEHANPDLKPEDAGQVSSAEAIVRKLEVTLNWSAFVEGEWTTRTSGGPASAVLAQVSKDLDTSELMIFVEKEADGDAEGALRVLVGTIDRGFRIATKNSPPKPIDIYGGPPGCPYSVSGWGATFHTGEDALMVFYIERIEEASDIFAPDETTGVQAAILGSAPHGPWQLLQANSRLTLPRSDIAQLVGPFFYADEHHTFFVEPALTETSFEKQEGWILDLARQDDHIDLNEVLEQLPVAVAFPSGGPPVPDPVDPSARYAFADRRDWVTNPRIHN